MGASHDKPRFPPTEPRIFQITNKSLLYIHVKTLNIKLLIDSGAAISILKPLDFLQNYELFSENLKIFGISESSITISKSIHFSMFSKIQKFYICNINSPFDGIRISINRCIIDFESQNLLVNGEKFPLFSIENNKKTYGNFSSY